ncbi:hypothetical protein F5880DRAFT_1615168 [Lentinula raphanica]|nr:hypothetical protein F5880DRAFT_1615168 [Lentinula raphanica]
MLQSNGLVYGIAIPARILEAHPRFQEVFDELKTENAQIPIDKRTQKESDLRASAEDDVLEVLAQKTTEVLVTFDPPRPRARHEIAVFSLDGSRMYSCVVLKRDVDIRTAKDLFTESELEQIYAAIGLEAWVIFDSESFVLNTYHVIVGVFQILIFQRKPYLHTFPRPIPLPNPPNRTKHLTRRHPIMEIRIDPHRKNQREPAHGPHIPQHSHTSPISYAHPLPQRNNSVFEHDRDSLGYEEHQAAACPEVLVFEREVTELVDSPGYQESHEQLRVRGYIRPSSQPKHGLRDEFPCSRYLPPHKLMPCASPQPAHRIRITPLPHNIRQRFWSGKT